MTEWAKAFVERTDNLYVGKPVRPRQIQDLIARRDYVIRHPQFANDRPPPCFAECGPLELEAFVLDSLGGKAAKTSANLRRVAATLLGISTQLEGMSSS